MLDVSIIILTFRRPDMLETAVRSCIQQDNRLENNYEVLVVDNCPEESAKLSLLRLAEESPIPIRYLSEPQRGISFARNAGVANTDSPLFAFIDDDERATSSWLDALYMTQQSFNADVVYGPVIPEFPDGRPPSFDPTGSYYTRDFHVSTGAEVRGYNTGNCLIVRKTCMDSNEPFHPAFALTGGEDTFFFRKLMSEGKRLIWCAEAKVFERIPVERTSSQYIIRRALRGGQTTSMISAMQNGQRITGVGRWMLIGLIQAMFWILPAALLLYSETPTAVHARVKFTGAIGKIFWMRRFQIKFYDTEKPTNKKSYNEY